jgi:hypothetical protein
MLSISLLPETAQIEQKKADCQTSNQLIIFEEVWSFEKLQALIGLTLQLSAEFNLKQYTD